MATIFVVLQSGLKSWLNMVTTYHCIKEFQDKKCEHPGKNVFRAF